MIKRLILIVLYFFFNCFLYADEGIWLPQINASYWETIKEKGLSLSIEDLCGEDSTSLKDAIIRFGNGCFGVIVSDNGLLMTNYHCALRYVEQVSTKEHDFLSEGYWAEKKPEIPIEGLSVRFLIKTEDVTDSLRSEDGRILPEKERKGKIKILEKRCTDKISGYEGKIVSMFSGNRYYLYQYQVFDDIRYQGFIAGMNRSQGIEKRKEEEALFEACLEKDPVSHDKYGSLLEEMRRTERDYAVNGTIPTCFIATNHTVGGNSGSPVFNASGELIGLNFDRNWEGTISDVMYDESVCRNITVDMRYVLFIIDKYAEAQSILKELVIHK